MVHIENKRSTGLENIDKDPDIDVPQDTLTEIQQWVSSVTFDPDDMLDTYRESEFDSYIVGREHFNGAADTVSIRDEDNIAVLHLEEFLEQ